jgi:hypothetical protein
LPLKERLFQGDLRPGHLVWVLVESQGAPAERIRPMHNNGGLYAARVRDESDSLQRATLASRCHAFEGACAAVREVGEHARPASICRAVVQSSLLDYGFESTDRPNADVVQQAREAMIDTAGMHISFPQRSVTYRVPLRVRPVFAKAMLSCSVYAKDIQGAWCRTAASDNNVGFRDWWAAGCLLGGARISLLPAPAGAQELVGLHRR